MKGKHEHIELTDVFALVILNCVLVSRCKEMILRLTTPETLADEIGNFRKQALREAEGSVAEGVAIEDEADAMRRAREHIEKLCADWLGGDPQALNPKPPVG